MTTVPPVIEFRSPSAPGTVLSTLALTGTGAGGTVPPGTVSTAANLRVYNNYAAAANVADAVNCTLASYDTATTAGVATLPPVLGAYLQVAVTDYNGTTTGQDTSSTAIGGSLKHRVPVNSATLPGAAANYCTVSLQLAPPITAAGVVGSQGLWLEYNYNL